MALQRMKLTVELSTGDVHDITVGNPSMVAWDRTRATRQWPAATEAPYLWMTFLAWHHMKAAGLIPSDTKHEEFESKLCVAIDDPETDERAAAEAAGEPWEADVVDPTARTPEFASASP